MFKNNKNLFIIAIIAIVNALGYGIIIPILYTYSQKYGLTDFQNGLLFSLFSICQFLATPIIGRLSDKYGRKPLLMISISGTALSFIMMAFAPSAIFLFLARALDGITSGNIPVASAVISDTTEPKDRARGFGIIGASFGFGFTFGPAISALTLQFGSATPFLIAAAISILAVILTFLILPETNKNIGVTRKGKLFDFVKLARAVVDPDVGKTLLISLLYTFAFGLFIYAYQPMAIKTLHFTATQLSINFTIFGIIGLLAQIFIIQRIAKAFGEVQALLGALVLGASAFAGLFIARGFFLFTIIGMALALSNAFVNPFVQALLSKETDEKSQGEMLGINASYVSIGLIFGPIIGGIMGTFSLASPFLLGSFSCIICCYLAYLLKNYHDARIVHLG